MKLLTLNNPKVFDICTVQEIKKMEPIIDKQLEMPPVMLEREPIDETIAHDELLNGYETSNLVFTDITTDLEEDVRKFYFLVLFH